VKQVFFILGLCGVIFAGGATSTLAQTNAAVQIQANKPFIKKRYTIHGSWNVRDANDGQTEITFSNDFKTKGGPDLKVYLSPKLIDGLDGKTALDGAVKIGVLKSNKGQQTYIVPADLNLSDYESVLIQCEAFSVLWGGFNL